MTESYRERPALKVVTLRCSALAAAITQDLGGGNGVAWWVGPDTPRNLLIADYLLGLTDSVTTNLALATMHHARYTELQHTADFNLIRRARAGALYGKVLAPSSPAEQDRQLEAHGHLKAFFLAVGSVLDNLAGVIMGAAGMPPLGRRDDIVHIDWNAVAVWKRDSPTHGGAKHLTATHRALIDQVIRDVDATLAAAPAGWVEWTLDMRNTLVHRAARIWIDVHDPLNTDSGIGHPLPRHPAQTHAESFARSTSIRGDLLARQSSETMQAILTAVIALAETVADNCLTAWNTRRSDPDCHQQPEKQWPPALAQGRTSNFDPPGRRLQLAPRGKGAIAVAPVTAHRIRVTRLEDQDRHLWTRWLANDAQRLAQPAKPNSKRS